MLRLVALAIGLLFCAAEARGQTYALRAAPLRAGPVATAAVVEDVDANQNLAVLRQSSDWVEVRAGVDLQGWLPAALVADHWLKVYKRERVLVFGKGDKEQRRFRVALGARNPTGPKRAQGDGATPEGRFFVAEADPAPEASRYGARSLRLSYPSVGDARRGLEQKQIDRATYLRILRAVRAGEVPPQRTRLGGSIRIHGGGSARDWTLGCVALDDPDLIWLYAQVGPGTRVDVYASEAAARQEGIGPMSRAILDGAKAQLAAKALYTAKAIRTPPVGFPGGDIDAGLAVCTDIIVRALRPAGLDLQALVFEDRFLHPGRYPGRRERPHPAFDHRRVRNLVPFLRRFAAAGAMSGTGELRPGDIVIFDTGIANGTPFDHIGFVDDQKDEDGQPRAINIWTVGYRTDSMSLIGKAYPTVVAWFRLGPPRSAW